MTGRMAAHMISSCHHMNDHVNDDTSSGSASRSRSCSRRMGSEYLHGQMQ